jgi:hypothetical protein
MTGVAMLPTRYRVRGLLAVAARSMALATMSGSDARPTELGDVNAAAKRRTLLA